MPVRSHWIGLDWICIVVHKFCIHLFLLQDPAVLQAINTQQHESRLTDASSSSTATAADTVPASQTQVTDLLYIHCHFL